MTARQRELPLALAQLSLLTLGFKDFISFRCKRQCPSINIETLRWVAGVIDFKLLKFTGSSTYLA